MDNVIEKLFPSAWKAHVNAGCWCTGNGEVAQRRPGIFPKPKEGESKRWDAFEPYADPDNPKLTGRCANHGCPVAAAEECKPTGTMYFVLLDFPEVGTTVKINTTSKASIPSLHSSLEEFKTYRGGMLMGITLELFIVAEKSTWADKKSGDRKTGTKWVWGLKRRAETIGDISAGMLEGVRAIEAIKGHLAEAEYIDEDDQPIEEDGPELAKEMLSEFYEKQPEADEGDKPADDPNVREKCIEVMKARLAYNKAEVSTTLGQYAGKLPQLLAELECQVKVRELLFRGLDYDAAKIDKSVALYPGARIFELHTKVQAEIEKRKGNAPTATAQAQEAPTNAKPKCPDCERFKRICDSCLKKEKEAKQASEPQEAAEPPKDKPKKKFAL